MTTTKHPHISLEDRWDHWSDSGLPTDIARRLAAVGAYNPAAVSTISGLTDELELYLVRHAPAAAVDRFLAADDTWQGRCDRLAALRTLERLSQLNVPALPRPRWAPPDPNLRRRVLTDVEIGLTRHCALTSTARAGVVGALDSGAASGELGTITPDDATGELTLRGTAREVKSGYPEAAPRSVPWATWCVAAVTKLLACPVAGRPLLYGGNSKDPAKVQSCLLMAVGAVLRDAGLAEDPTVKPLSIRNTFGRAIHDAGGGIEAAAAALGHDDLMTVAREIGLRPHKPARSR
jgi:integrase